MNSNKISQIVNKKRATFYILVLFALLTSLLALAPNAYAASEFVLQNTSNIVFSVDRAGNVNITGSLNLSKKM